MMILSALIESKVFIQGSNVNQKILKVIIGSLAELYLENEFLQESISAIFQKALILMNDNKQICLQAIEIIME